jgi:hypothetical protein
MIRKVKGFEKMFNFYFFLYLLEPFGSKRFLTKKIMDFEKCDFNKQLLIFMW